MMSMKQKNKAVFILKNLKPGLTLDLGYMGSGTTGQQIHNYLVNNFNHKIIGVDVQRGAEVKADLNKKFPFRDKYADNMIAADVIEHVIRPYDFLLECNRVLKPGGRLILTTPNAISLNNILRSEKDLTKDHKFCWLPYHLRNLLKAAKFKITKECVGNCWQNKWLVFKIIVKIFPKFDSGLRFVCEKVG
jgi:ubiquinone/menaquinone biosynthesis C-methylase UbiE